jgi:hypothetical protein
MFDREHLSGFLYSLKTSTLVPLLAAVLAAASPAQAETNSGPGGITLTADTPWIVARDEPEALRRALEDVSADWYKVFGHQPLILRAPPTNWPGSVIYLGLNGPWLRALAKDKFPGAESFLLRVQPDEAGRRALVATGADVRGAIYAAYALSEEVLGVDPWYYWTDQEPARRVSIEVPATLDKRFGPPTFKYRGWFINDEDLLAGFAPDPLRENVFSIEMWDRICETLLRLRGNMIVPGTFTFPDERCQELASRRGLVLNMHHILVVGLNTYRWPKDVPFSYSKNPELMERYWQTCIDAFKDKEVVWTVGYRGKHDRPFWADEPALKTPEARGDVITRAIAKQVELIRRVQSNAPCIANLWVEGADLYQQGHLKLPAGVTVVWPDDGTGLIRDKGRVQAGQGTYYHTAMLNGQANQLTEMVNPGRIYSELGRFAKAGATEYFLVNVSDIRPVPLSTDCAMRFVWNAAPYRDQDDRQNMEAHYADWSRREFGAEVAAKVAALYNQYFDIPYHRRTQRFGDNSLVSRLRDLDQQAAPLIGRNQPLPQALLDQARVELKFVGESKAQVETVASGAAALFSEIPAERRDYFQAHVVTPAQIHRQLVEMLESYATAIEAHAAGDKPRAIASAEAALRAADTLTAALHKAEYGKWAKWYSGERFVGLDTTRDRVRRLVAGLRGEPAPLLRTGRGYPELYEYQERFRENFPLLYPPKR